MVVLCIVVLYDVGGVEIPRASCDWIFTASVRHQLPGSLHPLLPHGLLLLLFGMVLFDVVGQ